ncbi:hypothetical protein KBZ08_08545 [Cyanobium sp. Candia 9D4]|uniref:hypothetical protein n=1 Tax=Cyanobium sp. Candia 9D4 TaxID=2823707 RepID=UPI0020CC9608|nr:hypothetical protein [Cyanobium sp. Candia 9D4]MCP9933966.1 hypothetical protein [Cyanobium sp. Candia 9D4]
MLDDAISSLISAGLIKEVDPSEERSEWSEAKPDSTFQVTPLLRKLQYALDLSLTKLRASNTPKAEAEQLSLKEMARKLAATMPDYGYKNDLIASIQELSRCLSSSCFIAVMALSGKILEIAIKHYFVVNSIPFQNDLMLGPLLRKLAEQGAYVDPGLKNVANIINLSRIPAVHSKENVPIPSKEQASMVVFATLDVLNRFLINA